MKELKISRDIAILAEKKGYPFEYIQMGDEIALKHIPTMEQVQRWLREQGIEAFVVPDINTSTQGGYRAMYYRCPMEGLWYGWNGQVWASWEEALDKAITEGLHLL